MATRISLIITKLFKLSLLFSVTSFCLNLFAQDCSSNDITLSSQSEINDFQSNQGPCNRVLGSLLIGHYGDTVNLDGLSSLQTIEGNLSIQNNFELVDVSGLGSLTRIGGTFHIYGNDKLPDLEGLSTLARIEKGLKIEWNDSLVDFSALYGLHEVGENMWGNSISISNNNALTNVDGLIGLSSISGGLGIDGNDALTHFGGLGNLTEIGGDLHLNSNRSLVDLSGLTNMTTVGGYLRIDNNETLAGLNGLNSLTSVGGYIEIASNMALRNITGLNNLGQVNGWLYINHNQTLESLSLPNLHYVPSCIEIRDNPVLTGLDLNNLSAVGSCLWINGNSSLLSMTGLSQLTSVGGSFEMRGNTEIDSLEGLENLLSAGSLLVQANSHLSDCAALSRLLDPVDDPPLGPGEALSAIPDIAGSVIINNNDSGCNSWLDIMASTPVYGINSGMNDAWFNPETDGQGFFVIVYPGIQSMFLSWFTYDVERPLDDVTAFLGDPGHRWLTAQGEYVANEALLEVWMAKGGVFDSPYPEPILNPDGEIIVEFDTCNSGTISYQIPSIDKQGSIPIERIALDNAAYCAALNPRIVDEAIVEEK